MALESLAKIYGASKPALPTVEFPKKYEKNLRRLIALQGAVAEHSAELKRLNEEVQAQSVRIAELMKDHEHGVLETTKDRILIDFVTRTSKRPDSKRLKKEYPNIYDEVLKVSESRTLKVSVESA